MRHVPQGPNSQRLQNDAEKMQSQSYTITSSTTPEPCSALLPCAIQAGVHVRVASRQAMCHRSGLTTNLRMRACLKMSKKSNYPPRKQASRRRPRTRAVHRQRRCLEMFRRRTRVAFCVIGLKNFKGNSNSRQKKETGHFAHCKSFEDSAATIG